MVSSVGSVFYQRFVPHGTEAFPWTDAQKADVAKLAQAVLAARAKHTDSILADLYDVNSHRKVEKIPWKEFPLKNGKGVHPDHGKQKQPGNILQRRTSPGYCCLVTPGRRHRFRLRHPPVFLCRECRVMR